MTRLLTVPCFSVVTIFLVTGVALLALAAQVSDVGATDLEDAYTGQMSLCEALGGTVDPEGTHENRTHSAGRTGATIKCNGSMIGGYQCELTGENGTVSVCSQTRTELDEDIDVTPVGGVEDVSEPEASGPGGAGGIAVQPGSAEDPASDGDGPIERQVLPADQAGACETLGGTATLIEQTTRPVSCTGGFLDGMDGMICYGTICDYFSEAAGSDEGQNAAPTGGMLVVSVAPGDELGDTTGAAKDPTEGETMVIMNQSGPTVGETTANQAAICRGLGGTSTTIEHGSEVSIVECKGGLLDGMTCFNAEDATNCMFVSLIAPEDPGVTPAAGVEAPAADAPTATVAATETAPTPTATPPAPPTVAPPAEPPAQPTMAPPSDPPPPKNDNSVPPGGLEDPIVPEPTPTPVVLT